MARKLQLMELPPEETQQALASRQVFRITCCGKLMCQDQVYSHMADTTVTFPRSEVVLICHECKRRICLELTTVPQSRQTLVEHVQKGKPNAY